MAPQWVLTAAHCVEAYPDMEVVLGQNNLLDTGGEVISVTYSIVHPDRDPELLSADLALLHLAWPSSIDPVTLADDFDFYSEKGKSALAIGWGTIYQSIIGNISSINLQEAVLTIEDNDICHNPFLPENIICIGTSDKKNTCRGYSAPCLFLTHQLNAGNRLELILSVLRFAPNLKLLAHIPKLINIGSLSTQQ